MKYIWKKKKNATADDDGAFGSGEQIFPGE